jgi:hypothetical protein
MTHGHFTLEDSQAPVTATAVLHPCELYDYHRPVPARTQGHHIHPVYLQNRLFGRIVDNELLWVCGTCHDNVHEWLTFLLGEGRRPPPEPGRLAKAAAQRTFDWYTEQLAAKPA